MVCRKLITHYKTRILMFPGLNERALPQNKQIRGVIKVRSQSYVGSYYPCDLV